MNSKTHNLTIGKEYEVQDRFAKLLAIEGSTAVCLDRFDRRFECDLGEVREKQIPKKKNENQF